MPSGPGFDSAQAVAGELRQAIEKSIPGARAEVAPTQPGHFELRVVSDVFRGRSRVEQHQLVYGAITPLMQGERAPVHAIDRLETLCP